MKNRLPFSGPANLPSRGARRVVLAAVVWLLLWCSAGTAHAIDVIQTEWGFDGQIVLQRFNLFSALVDNSSATPFEGTIQLKKFVAGKQVDALIAEPVYLAPFSRRWVQFYPYIKTDWDTWEISWGKAAKERYTPANPRTGNRAAVLLEDPDAISQGAGAIKRLRADLFPPHSTATDCLAALVIDHVPRWDTARQRSFLEWLKRGGRVYLFRTPEGKPLEFTGDLAELNKAADQPRVGAGFVYLVDRTRRQLDKSYVEQVIEAGKRPGAGTVTTITNVEPPVSADPQATMATPSPGYQFSHYKWEVEGTLLTKLKKMSNPNHSWALIFLLGLMYMALLCPGCYAVGQKYSGDYRKTFGFLLITVTAFSLVFLFVGRRGYNEVTVVHAVATARQTPGGNFDVTQWSNAFVVAGGDYTFTHPGTARIYSTCQDEETVRGEIRNGAEAHFTADMPPYSSRPFSHRGQVAAPPIDVTVVEWGTEFDQTPLTSVFQDAKKIVLAEPARSLIKLKLKKGRSFPAQAAGLYALCGRRLYRLKDHGDSLQLDTDLGTLAAVLKTDLYSEFGARFDPTAQLKRRGMMWQDPTQDEVFLDLFYPLLARSLNLTDQDEVDEFVFPGDRLRLLIYAPMPETLYVSNPLFNRQQGYVLYSLDLFEQ